MVLLDPFGRALQLRMSPFWLGPVERRGEGILGPFRRAWWGFLAWGTLAPFGTASDFARSRGPQPGLAKYPKRSQKAEFGRVTW